MSRKIIIAAVAISVAIVGCGDSGGGGGDGKVNSANDQAQMEYRACEKQADSIANTQGADAGSAKLQECVDNLANETQVSP